MAAAKSKGCGELNPWIRSICNHFWWSCATCNQDLRLLTEKWTSIIFHIQNIHEWEDGESFLRCAHAELDDQQSRKKIWLKQESPALKALHEIVYKPRRMKELAHLTKFSHTGSVEVYHALLKKYCTKSIHFSLGGMLARCQLAALDHNAGAFLQQAVNRRGDLRFNVVFPKQSKIWVAKPIKEHKNRQYQRDLVLRVIEVVRDNITLPKPDLQEQPGNIASTPRPPKEEVVRAHRSRFSM